MNLIELTQYAATRGWIHFPAVENAKEIAALAVERGWAHIPASQSHDLTTRGTPRIVRPKWTPDRRRQWQTEYRAAFIARGLTSRGTIRKRNYRRATRV